MNGVIVEKCENIKQMLVENDSGWSSHIEMIGSWLFSPDISLWTRQLYNLFVRSNLEYYYLVWSGTANYNITFTERVQDVPLNLYLNFQRKRLLGEID